MANSLLSPGQTRPTSSARCQPGDRARVISASQPENIGKIVVIVCGYSCKELVEGGTWPSAGVPWVVAALGTPLAHINTQETIQVRFGRMAVFDDSCLVPLRDSDGGTEDAVVRINQLAPSCFPI